MNNQKTPPSLILVSINVIKKEWLNLLRRVREYLLIEKQRGFQVIPEISMTERNVSASFYAPLNKIGFFYFVEEHQPYFQAIKKLFDSYENTRQKTEKFLKKNFQIDDALLPSTLNFPHKYENNKWRLYLGDIRGSLEDMDKEIEKTITLLDEMSFQVPVTPEIKEELRFLEKIVDEEIYIHLPEYALDLKQSIDYFKKGLFLGSVLIAGRVISVCLDKVNSKIPSEKKETWKNLPSKQKNEEWWLEIRKILKIESKEENIFKAIKEYRVTFTHKINIHPSTEEALLVLTGAIFLTKKIIDIYSC